MRDSSYEDLTPPQETYNSYQGLGMEIGFVMILIGIMGIFWPSILGLNVGVVHALVLILTGGLAVWSGLCSDPRRVYKVSLFLGIFYLFHVIAAPLLGEPEIMRFDFFSSNTISRIAPGFLELSTYDHLLHGILSIFFFNEALNGHLKLKGKNLKDYKFKIKKMGYFFIIPLIVLAVVVIIYSILKYDL